MTENRVQKDDLTQISGIGINRSQWLQETFGIQTYAELAALHATEVEKRLKKDGKTSPGRAEIESWLATAASFAEQQHTVSDNEGAWLPIANFLLIVEEQNQSGEMIRRTRTIHEEDQDTRSWQGISLLAASDWMLRKLSTATEQRFTEEVAITSAQPQAVIGQPEASGKFKDEMQGILRKMFALSETPPLSVEEQRLSGIPREPDESRIPQNQFSPDVQRVLMQLGIDPAASTSSEQRPPSGEAIPQRFSDDMQQIMRKMQQFLD
ncbi:MAG: hypothetical protein KC496_05175 [Anaerolineae bacterium]|nr:hypothetical protein [Anaerolineae bacterium]